MNIYSKMDNFMYFSFTLSGLLRGLRTHFTIILCIIFSIKAIMAKYQHLQNFEETHVFFDLQQSCVQDIQISTDIQV